VVLTRARGILRLLEGGHLVATAAPNTSARGVPDEQLSLSLPGVPHPVVARLRSLDPNTMTPIEAIRLLAELVEESQ
jgi:hypothetical protein